MTHAAFAQLVVSVSQFPGEVVLQHLAGLQAEGRVNTARTLVYIAVADERKHYALAGFSSMHAYCVEALGLSEDSASRRIHAARAVRRFPAIFEAVADGRLNLTGLGLLAPHLTSRTSESEASELIVAASRKTKAGIKQLLADRFPRFDVPESLAPGAGSREHALAHVAQGGSCEHAPAHVASGVSGEHAPAHALDGRTEPLGLDRFALQVTLDRDTHDKLRYAQCLLAHVLPSGELAGVLGRALEALIAKLERRKFGVAKKPREMSGSPGRPAPNPRSIPAAVKRAVLERDGGRCSFVSTTGHCCDSVQRLEFDHIVPVALGGEPTVENLRLLCRIHNQLEAERTLGQEFMAAKRRKMMARRDSDRASHEPASSTDAGSRAEIEDVIPWLRSLGFKREDACRGAAAVADLADASLGERVKLAIASLGRARALAGRMRASSISCSSP